VPSFRGWVHEEVQHQFKRFLPKPAHDVIDETFTVIRHDAEMRGRVVLLQAMGAENQFHADADFHHAVNVLVQAVVAGVFGEFPLTKQEQATKLKTLDALLDSMPWVAEWDAAVKQAKVKAAPVTVTMDDVKKAAEQMKDAGYGAVVMGRNVGKSKSGLPAAQDAVKAEEEALGQLLGKVEKKSDELLGIKQKAKYEELVGIDPEDI
jgi:hypothetical protein